MHNGYLAFFFDGSTLKTSTVSPSSVPLFAIAVLLVAIASLQFGATLAKSMFPAVGPLGTTTLRLAVGAVLLMAVLRPWRVRVSGGQFKALLMYGVSLGMMNMLFYTSLATIPLGIAVSLEFLGPLAVALAGSRRPRDIAWVVIAAGGLLLMVPRISGVDLDPVGMMFALGAGLCWALYIIFGKKAGAAYGTSTAAWGTALASLVVLPVGLWHAGTALFDPSLLPIALSVGVLSTAIPFTLEMMALTRMPASVFGMMLSLEPAFAALFGLLFLHEQLHGLQWLGISAVIVASAGTAMSARR